MSTTQARATMSTELRAPVGFTKLYQGVSCTTPIVLSSTPDGLDPRASLQLGILREAFRKNGNTFPIPADGSGVSPFLVAGVPVPLFASVLLLIPGVSSFVTYKYAIYWRIRSFETAATDRNPFHGQNSEPGPTDDGRNKLSPPPGGAAWSGSSTIRYPIIAAGDSLMYAQDEPGVLDTYANQNLYQVITLPDQPYVPAPIFNGFTTGQVALGDVSQGLTTNPDGITGAVKHIPMITRSFGDEMVVLVFRDPVDGAPNWDFEAAGADADFPVYYGDKGRVRDGVKSKGILVFTGVAP